MLGWTCNEFDRVEPNDPGLAGVRSNRHEDVNGCVRRTRDALASGLTHSDDDDEVPCILDEAEPASVTAA